MSSIHFALKTAGGKLLHPIEIMASLTPRFDDRGSMTAVLIGAFHARTAWNVNTHYYKHRAK